MESTDMANIEKIDLNEFLDKLMHGMKRLWWLILLLTVFGIAIWIIVFTMK